MVVRGGGRGYGNVSRKVTKYFCRGNWSDSSVDQEIPDKRLMKGLVSSTDNSMGSSVRLENRVGILIPDTIFESESQETK